MKLFTPRNNHSHPTAAMYRSGVNAFMTRLVTSAGFIPYQVSMSATDKCDGTRLFYGQKDLAIPYKHDSVKDQHVIIMTDVDYYTDINKWLSYGRPILMYTMVPKTVVGRTQDYAYRIVNGRLEMHVAGGSTYTHELWDYQGDTVSIVAEDGKNNEHVICFHLEQRDIPGDPDHKFIVFTPYAYIPAPYYYVCIEPTPVRRKCFGDTINYLFEPITNTLSISENGSWNSVELDATLYSAIQQRLLQKTTPTLIVDVERHLRAAEHPRPAVAAPLVYQLMNCTIDKNVVMTKGCITTYHPLGTLVNEDGKPSGSQVCTPMLTEAGVFPSNSVASDEATVRGRIDKVRNNVVPPRKYNVWRNDFITTIVKHPGTGGPIGTGDVAEVQNKPMQRARFVKSECTLTTTPINELKSFVKVEPYTSINDPRNITTMIPELTTELSAYSIPFKDEVLKDLPWYGPGKTPIQAVEKLQEMAMSDKPWIVTDFSRMDGTISEWMQHFLTEIMLRWVRDEYKDMLRYLLLQVLIMKGRTKHGIKYQPGWGNRSGSPVTTILNTLVSILIVYMALRSLGQNHNKAWSMIQFYCLKYGDDGVDILCVEGLDDAITSVAEDLGLKIKIEVIPMGCTIPYLGRYFVDPSSMPDSFQDPLRTIDKLHLSSNTQVTARQAQFNKASGYITTDRLTPIIGSYCKVVLDSYAGMSVRGETSEERYKMSNAWPQYESHKNHITQSMAELLKIEYSELKRLDEMVSNVTNPEEFPVLFEKTMKVNLPAIYGEVIVEQGEHYDQDDIQSAAVRPQSQPASDQTSGGTTDNSQGHAEQVARPKSKRRPNRGRCSNTKEQRGGASPNKANPKPNARSAKQRVARGSRRQV
ncbi:hypothetical protein [Shuangao insect virus 10]|uniref:hypothetical protein n=1 Tax=Shuangao insect virus 10 TaxID=1923466 RepID=UPI00090BE4F5|nr:hypothetical protein [Shuangao insect virus 10]APG76301.1 hypothetical protein [Shuangao insect virus 10]